MKSEDDMQKIKNRYSGLKGMLLGYGFGLAIFFGGLTAMNRYQHHNVVYDDRWGSHVMEMANGLGMSYTRVSLKEDGGIKVSHRPTFSADINYIDNDEDGLVDKIEKYYGLFHRGASYDILTRDADYDSHKEMFDKADMEFQKQIERFNPLMDK